MPFLNFKIALNRVIRVWYVRRIQEETVKNLKLRELHDDLTRKKLEIQYQQMNASAETQSLVSGEEV